MAQTRLSGHAAKLRRNNQDTRQNSQQQHQHPRGARVAYRQNDTYASEDHQAAYLQGYYNVRETAVEVSAPHEALSPSSNSSSTTPRKLLQNRRQNMMQRRIEIRQKQQQQQQQRSRSLDRSAACQGQPQNEYGSGQSQRLMSSQNHSHLQHNLQQQAQYVDYSNNRAKYPNNLSLLKGHNESHHMHYSSHQQDMVHQHHSSHYPISPQNEDRPPSHPNSSTSRQRNHHQNFYPRTQPERQHPSHVPKQQQLSPFMQSPPVLDRKQNMMVDGEYVSTNLFSESGMHIKSLGRYYDDYGEGFEVEAQQYAPNPTNPSRIPSPYESPSDEVLVEDGYYEDEVQQPQMNPVGVYEQQSQHAARHRQSSHVHNQIQQQPSRQQHNMQQQIPYIEHYSQHQQAPMDEMNQVQPDWHQLNRNRLYQKKFSVRYHNAASNSSPKFQSQMQSLRSSPTKQPNVANFSPIESLSNRTDQIQRKQRQPTQSKSYEASNKFEGVNNESNQHRGQPDEGEESVASVLDRARSFEASYAQKYAINSGESRSKSVPRERAHQLPSNPTQKDSSRYYDEAVGRRRSQDLQFADDDTVTESVASRKKEWEGRLQPSQQDQQKVRQHPENEAFGVWSERANRLAQQRLSEQKTEQRKQRTEQRKSIEEKWRRSAAKSMSPEHRRRNQEEQYGNVPVYSESMDGHRFPGHQHMERHADQYSIEQDSTHMSIEDRRRMLWDGKERLRAVLPKDSSFDSANRQPENCSPGTASGSQGSAFFKSKFVHAAAVATQHRANFDVIENQGPRASPKGHSQKPGAVSSHYTDSTAGTTPVGSNGSSHLTQSTGISRTVDQYRMPPTENNDAQPRNRPSQSAARVRERSQSAGSGNRVSVMPSIAETPRSSVADLIARINAVSRSNPAEALAAIDSIIKAESALPIDPQQKPVKQAQSPFSPSRPSAVNQVQPLGKDFFQSKYKECEHETAKVNGKEEEEDDESYLSSEDSTVSSMTNPTYQSIPVHNRSPSESNENRGVDKRPQFSPPVLEELEVKPSKNTRKHSALQPPSTQNNIQSNSNSHSDRQRRGDMIVSKPSNDSPEDTDKRRSVEATIGGLNYRLSKSKSEEQTIRNSPSNIQQQQQHGPRQLPKENNKEKLDSAWIPLPKNDFFQAGKVNNRPNHNQREKSPESKPSLAQQSQTESKYVSYAELNPGQTTGLPSVVSDAFSGIDIDLEDEPASSSVQQRPQSDLTSQAFTTVDIDMEPKKTVRQRRQELEYLAKIWNEKSPKSEDDAVKPSASLEQPVNTNDSSSNAVGNYDWAVTPAEKKKVRAEPALRLKGSNKLAQKFASLVKAFESD